MTDRSASRLRRLGRIAAAALADVPVRFSRYTVGAARRLLALAE